jgi:hypothetical protein
VSAWVPGPPGLLYLSVYPPALAVLLAPLGLLAYLPALLVWTLMSSAMYVAAGAMVIRRSRPFREDLISSYLLLLGFPAFWQMVLFGQVSAFIVLLLALSFIAWRAGRPLLAGLALGALAMKPQMLVFAATAALLLRSFQLVIGILAGIACEGLLTLVIVGPTVLRESAGAMMRVMNNPAAFEPKAEQIQSLRGFVLSIIGGGPGATALVLAASIALLVIAARAVNRAASSDLRYAVVVLAGALLNPHLYTYDLVVLIVPLGIIGGWLFEELASGRRHPGPAMAVRLLYWLPLLAPVLGLLKVQLMAPTMAALLWLLGARVRTRSTGHPEIG